MNWVLGIAIGWTVFAAVVAVVIGKGIRRADDIELGSNRFDFDFEEAA